jgi:hypothetical protein
VGLVEQGLKDGGLGIGVVPGYARGSGYKELLAVHQLAAKYGIMAPLSARLRQLTLQHQGGSTGSPLLVGPTG